jgi:hypothetical protein
MAPFLCPVVRVGSPTNPLLLPPHLLPPHSRHPLTPPPPPPLLQVALSSGERRTKDDAEKRSLVLRLEKEHEADETEYVRQEAEVAEYLEKALLNYADCMRLGDAYDADVLYRLISLWFTSYMQHGNASNPEGVYSKIDEVPSHKFLPLVRQITSRLAPIPTRSPHAAEYSQPLQPPLSQGSVALASNAQQAPRSRRVSARAPTPASFPQPAATANGQTLKWRHATAIHTLVRRMVVDHP